MTTILPEACWLWPRAGYQAKNSYAGFRHDFEMQTMPTAAPLAITADQSYRLWVNGRYVCRGPLRGHQAEWFFDTVELLPYLKTGKNWIAVEAYNPGISHFSYTYRDAEGFLCSGAWDNGIKIVSRLEDWLVFRNTSYRSDTGRLSVQTGFQEEQDLRFDDRSWITEESGYSIPPQPPWAQPMTFAQGALPWSTLRPRPTPMLEEKFQAPAAILAFGQGNCSCTPGSLPFADNNFIRDFALNELAFLEYSEPPHSATEKEALCFTVPPSGKNRYSAILLDLGRLNWLPGTALLEAETEEDGVVADLAFLHHIKEGKIQFIAPVGQGSLCTPGARFHLRFGRNVGNCCQITGTRYTALIVRGNVKPVAIRFAWRSAVSPLPVTGDFRCGNPDLDDIFAISKHTQRCCTMDTFVDTPWREQSQWWGDARIQAKNVFFLTGSSQMLEQGIRSIAGQPGPEGLLFANAPTSLCGPVLPDYCLTWIQTLYDFYMQTGRTDLFVEQKSRAEEIFGYFERQRGSDGLLRYDPRFWLFEDWARLPKRNTPAFLNLLFFYTRQFYCRLLEVSGFADEAEALKKILKQEQRRLADAFWDPAQGLYVPEIDAAGKRTGVPSVHDQVLAILSGLAPERDEIPVQKRILPCLKKELPPEVAQPSSYWATYLLQAAQKYHLIHEALAYLKEGWNPMREAGTAWELFTEKTHADASVCHAWSGHPLYHLPELFFGLKQLAPQWKKIELAPEFLTECASLVLPVPGGMLKCRWDKEKFHLELPAGVEAELRLPGNSRQLSGPALLDIPR